MEYMDNIESANLIELDSSSFINLTSEKLVKDIILNKLKFKPDVTLEDLMSGEIENKYDLSTSLINKLNEVRGQFDLLTEESQQYKDFIHKIQLNNVWYEQQLNIVPTKIQQLDDLLTNVKELILPKDTNLIQFSKGKQIAIEIIESNIAYYLKQLEICCDILNGENVFDFDENKEDVAIDMFYNLKLEIEDYLNIQRKEVLSTLYS